MNSENFKYYLQRGCNFVVNQKSDGCQHSIWSTVFDLYNETFGTGQDKLSQ